MNRFLSRKTERATDRGTHQMARARPGGIITPGAPARNAQPAWKCRVVRPAAGSGLRRFANSYFVAARVGARPANERAARRQRFAGDEFSGRAGSGHKPPDARATHANGRRFFRPGPSIPILRFLRHAAGSYNSMNVSAPLSSGSQGAEMSGQSGIFQPGGNPGTAMSAGDGLLAAPHSA